MAITTQYFGRVSLVKLTGNLTLAEVTGNILKHNRGEDFKQLAVRIIDASDLFNVAFDQSKMKGFTAIDKSGFLNNDDIDVLMVSKQPEFVELFEQYAGLMQGTRWRFHLISDLKEAVSLCQQLGHSIELSQLT